nr:MAG TPA: hypothetical protein [Caudoviricetes sp.]
MHFAIPRPNRVWNIFSPRSKNKTLISPFSHRDKNLASPKI